MKKYIFYFLLVSQFGIAQKPYSQQMADAFMAWYPDSIVVKPRVKSTWDYEQGFMLKALEKVWHRNADAKYYEYILADMNRFVNEDGSMKTYKIEDYNLDNINSGRALLMISHQSQQKKEKYKKAADILWSQLENQPKNKEGAYWHKLRYPNQIWLDGLFMAEPFSAEYAKIFKHPEHFDHIAKQFAMVEKYMVDPKTGLIYHGYDESKEQQWADKKTGLSPHFWGRSIGWYAMALVEVLDYFPENHPARPNLIKYLQRLAPALVKYQDQKTGVWYQMTALGNKEGNYLEASTSCMFVYALAKGVRKGYLSQNYLFSAKKGYKGILKEFVITEPDGSLALEKTVSVGGLGGNPYRDGTFEYYIGEPLRKNDLKGVGSFIFASVEMEIAEENQLAKNQTVALDYHFNHEFRKDWNGDSEQFHYVWEDTQHSGFLWWGEIFQNYGAKLKALKGQPTAANLKGVNVYIIVDPDTKKETASPNYVAPKDIKEIKTWVNNGGTLVLMANDTANCEIPKLNELSKAFGIAFTGKSRNMVQGMEWHQGKLDIPAGNKIFPNTEKVYVKELVTLQLSGNAYPVIEEGGDVIMAATNFGKGRVFVIGDPWLYNEYVDGRRIPKEYQNYQAAKDLAKWVLNK
ncbi:glycoside hydrolase family 88 protein [Lacihabitans sp. LS3-19]|uniref:glycoside hydrolase family 88/105 protein n=1 Tax=Lacihabitans sp. LS3-19 TaxID=2487335 RepID=UPI0020CCC1F1|nr:glycoside hydrolase family 88 protein [Lacihabitans sp. LS3-19]MCP9770224.1 glycoside hydrolase family 88 protein [Lacihabitans sp. LS3-19]